MATSSTHGIVSVVPDAFSGPPEAELALRRDSIGAFAHEIRTPLTSIRMVIELARREGGPELVLDAELARMLISSIDDLNSLADDLQEISRHERGRLKPLPGPAGLAKVIERAQATLGTAVIVHCEGDAAIEGPWDEPRFARAIAGFAQAADRCGGADGRVQLSVSAATGRVCLIFHSGKPGGEPRELGSDASFAFYLARVFVLAMGGSVTWSRTRRHCEIIATLPA